LVETGTNNDEIALNKKCRFYIDLQGLPNEIASPDLIIIEIPQNLGFGDLEVGTLPLAGTNYLTTYGVFPNPIPGKSWFVYKGGVLGAYFPGAGDVSF
jgi:hypothetical protein